MIYYIQECKRVIEIRIAMALEVLEKERVADKSLSNETKTKIVKSLHVIWIMETLFAYF